VFLLHVRASGSRAQHTRLASVVEQHVAPPDYARRAS
jgi:hypothetical protein